MASKSITAKVKRVQSLIELWHDVADRTEIPASFTSICGASLSGSRAVQDTSGSLFPSPAAFHLWPCLGRGPHPLCTRLRGLGGNVCVAVNAGDGVGAADGIRRPLFQSSLKQEKLPLGNTEENLRSHTSVHGRRHSQAPAREITKL